MFCQLSSWYVLAFSGRFCYIPHGQFSLPLKTKGYIDAIRFDILDDKECSAILVDAPTTINKINKIDQNIREIVCGQDGPNSHVINDIVGMPLFCFQSKYLKKDFVTVGIKFKIKDNVKTFYNIGAEKKWIKSALKEKEYNGVIALWVYVKKVRFIVQECEEILAKNDKSDNELVKEKTSYFKKCKICLKKCLVKSKTKSLLKCCKFVRKCQSKMGMKFKNLRKKIFDEFSDIYSLKKFQQGSNNSSRFSLNLFLWPILNILLYMKAIINNELL